MEEQDKKSTFMKYAIPAYMYGPTILSMMYPQSSILGKMAEHARLTQRTMDPLLAPIQINDTMQNTTGTGPRYKDKLSPYDKFKIGMSAGSGLLSTASIIQSLRNGMKASKPLAFSAATMSFLSTYGTEYGPYFFNKLFGKKKE